MAVASSRRIDSIDFIKFAAIFAVVVTHSGIPYWSHAYGSWDSALRSRWVNFHVPSFLILSGFLYHAPAPAGVDLLWKRVKRILVPYLIASTVLFVSGFSDAKTAQQFAVALATGSALGIYYYIFALFCCLPLVWILSRLSSRWAIGILGALVGYQLALMIDPHWGVDAAASKFWRDRDVLGRFYWGYFLIGWVVAGHQRRLKDLYERHRPVILGVCVLLVLAWMLSPARLPVRYWTQGRVVYTLAVLALMISSMRDLRAGPLARFVSEGTYTVYLYHRAFQIALLPYVILWHPAVRIVTLVIAGFLGSAALIGLGHLLLGRRRSRDLLGA